MSSTDPPSRIPPRQQPQDTKAARDELSSKGKIEKVREVDPDEETRKKKFLKYYKDQDISEGEETKPSPFDLYSQKAKFGKTPSFGDVEDAVVPGPGYTPPPDLGAQPPSPPEEEEAGNGSLPQSDDFWDDFDLPDQPTHPSQFQEAPSSKKKEGPPSKREKEIKEELLSKKNAAQMKKKEKGQMPETSPFGPPGKATEKSGQKPPSEREKEKQRAENFPSVFEESAKKTPTAARATQKKEPEPREISKEKRESIEEVPLVPFEKSQEQEGQAEKRKEGKKNVEIESPSLPALPVDVVPMAMQATNQVASYLHPTTLSLFYQMVGTIFIAQSQPGVVRTEIMLNNPSYANSKFYGAIITIEKYATAPDSFNIRLTGSHEAVVSFKENIPSLMNAFQNGNFSFRVNRLDAEYTLERPVFRRKERGEGKSEPGGGGLGEKR